MTELEHRRKNIIDSDNWFMVFLAMLIGALLIAFALSLSGCTTFGGKIQPMLAVAVSSNTANINLEGTAVNLSTVTVNIAPEVKGNKGIDLTDSRAINLENSDIILSSPTINTIVTGNTVTVNINISAKDLTVCIIVIIIIVGGIVSLVLILRKKRKQ